MPGPYVHMAVADHVARLMSDSTKWPQGALPVLDGPLPKELAAIANRHKKYYALGAVGPDLFFFLPDFRRICILGQQFRIANSLIGVGEILERAYENLDEYILTKWERYFGPGNENVDEALSRMTGDLTTVVSDILGGFSSLLSTVVMDVASQSKDWWGNFSLGLNKGYDNQDFFWSDMLHYRKTSRFGAALWTLADQTVDPEVADRLRAYALGYITHLATDTTGHPFVNEKSGGPFRSHWQRHHLVENHMDAHTYDVDHGTDPGYSMMAESALHYRISFEDDGRDGQFPLPEYWNAPRMGTLRELYVRRRHLDLDSKMPAELAKLLFDAMDLTYDTASQSSVQGFPRTTPDIIKGADGRPQPEAIQLAYDLLFRYLKFSTLDGFRHEKPSPPDLIPNWDFPILTDPHDDPPGEGDHDTDWLSKILRILRFIRWLVAVAIWFATIIPAILLDVATYVPRLIAYYSIELPLYYMIKAERAILVMTGYFHPLRDEIDPALVQLGNNNRALYLKLLLAIDNVLFVEPDDAFSTLMPIAENLPDPNYPHGIPRDEDNEPIEYHAPWNYPSSPTELPSTFAGPYASGSLPHILLENHIAGNQGLRSNFEEALTPADTDNISQGNVNAGNHLGDPVNFSAYLIWQLTRTNFSTIAGVTRITDWNLDSDRGYAYKCWDWNRHDKTEGLLLDKDGHGYVKPCTPPPQSEEVAPPGHCPPADKSPYDSKQPLKIFYLDQEDPHCQ